MTNSTGFDNLFALYGHGVSVDATIKSKKSKTVTHCTTPVTRNGAGMPFK